MKRLTSPDLLFPPAFLLCLALLLTGCGLSPVRASSPDAGAGALVADARSQASPPSSPALAAGRPPAELALEAPPDPELALHRPEHAPQNATRYGTEAGRLHASRAPAVGAEALLGPSLTLGGWKAHPLFGSERVSAVVALPDGRIAAGLYGAGLRIYGPDASGLYSWSEIRHSPRFSGGLASDWITALAVFEDELWVGTGAHGVSVWYWSADSWTTYDTSNSALPSDDVRGLRAVDPSPAGVWVSTAAGAARAQPGGRSGGLEITVTDASDGLPHSGVFDVLERQVGDERETWFATEQGLSRLAGGQWAHFGTSTPMNGSCPAGRATRLAAESGGAIWIINETYAPSFLSAQDARPGRALNPDAGDWVYAGICRFQPRVSPAWTMPSSALQAMGPARDLAIDAEDRLWIAFQGDASHDGGVVVHELGTWGIHEQPTDGLNSDQAISLATTGDALWVGHLDQSLLSSYTPNWTERTSYEMGSGAYGNAHSLLVEHDTLWVGVGNGLSRRRDDGSGWTHKMLPGSSAGPIVDLVRDGDGVLWAASANGGLFRVHEFSGTYSLYAQLSPGLPSQQLRALAVDGQNRLWAATPGAISVLSNNVWTSFDGASSGLAGSDITDLVVDASERLWIATADAGVGVLSLEPEAPGSWTWHGPSEGLGSLDVRALALQPGEALWAATAQGVQRFDFALQSWTDESAGLPSLDVLSVDVAGSGEVWAGHAGGLSRHSGGWQTWRVPGGRLASDRVTALATSGSQVWTLSFGRLALRDEVEGPLGHLPPQIDAFSPDEGSKGTNVTITGQHFDPRAPELNQVSFCCVDGPSGLPRPKGMVLSASSSELQVSVPEGAKTGAIQVRSHGLSATSAEDFEYVPAITWLSRTCGGPGDELEIKGHGFDSAGNGPVYIRIGEGPERVADSQSAGRITQFFRHGDSSGTVKIRLQNGPTIESVQWVHVAEPVIAAVAQQQDIEGLPMVWEKSMVALLGLKDLNTPANPTSHCGTVDGGQAHWIHGGGQVQSIPAADDVFLPGGELGYGPQQPIVAPNYTASFVTDHGDPQFALSELEGLRLTLKKGWMTVISHTIPASQMDFVELQDPRYMRSLRIMPPTWPSDFWSRTFQQLKDVARYFVQDEPWLNELNPNQPKVEGYLAMAPMWVTRSSKVNLDWYHQFDWVTEQSNDYVEAAGNDRGIGLISEALYTKGTPGGRANFWSNNAAVFNGDFMANTFVHEVLHTDVWVTVTSGHHDFFNTHHSRYDEGEWEKEDASDCDVTKTFRRALVNQLGGTRRVLRIDGNTPFQFPLNGCDPATQPRSVMAYVPERKAGSNFLEPLDRTKALNGSSYLLQVYDGGLAVKALCEGCRPPASLSPETLRGLPMEDRRGHRAEALEARALTEAAAGMDLGLDAEGRADESSASTKARLGPDDPRRVHWLDRAEAVQVIPPLAGAYRRPLVLASSPAARRAGEASAARAGVALSQAPGSLRLTGRIEADGSVSTRLFHTGPETPEHSYANPLGSHRVNFLGSEGELLAAHGFQPAFGGPYGESPVGQFNLTLPMPPGVAEIEIRDAFDQRRWQAAMSAGSPSVELLAPQEGSFGPEDEIAISWSASDPDGDPLRYALDYSPDGGRSWILVQPLITQTQTTWTPGMLAGPTDEGRLRVRASDGFRQAQDQSGPLTLSGAKPIAEILLPGEDETHTQGAAITLEGGSFSWLGMNSGSFDWFLDGSPLGSGRLISATLASAGSVELRLEVDIEGETASATRMLQVQPDLDGDGISDEQELVLGMNRLDPWDADRDPDGDGLSTRDELLQGLDPFVNDSDGDGSSDGSEIAQGTSPLNPLDLPPSAPRLQLGSEMVHMLSVGGAAPSTQKVWLTHAGPTRGLAWTASADQSWLDLGDAAGDTPERLWIGADPSALATGVHTATVTVQAPDASNAPRTITVRLEVLPGPSAPPTPLPTVGPDLPPSPTPGPTATGPTPTHTPTPLPTVGPDLPPSATPTSSTPLPTVGPDLPPTKTATPPGAGTARPPRPGATRSIDGVGRSYLPFARRP